MVVVVGEILFDCFADHRRLGGAPFNFAYHLNKLGRPIRFVSRIGKDADGQAVQAFMRRHHFPDADLQKDDKHPTGQVRVTMGADGQHHEFQILQNMAYDHIELTAGLLQAMDAAQMVYFGTLIQRTPKGRKAVARLVDAKGDLTRCFVDINLRPDCYDTASVLFSLQAADVLKLNSDELAEVRQICHQAGKPWQEVPELMDVFGIEMVALTMGTEGSQLYADGRIYSSPAPAVTDFKDSVGAGDAFAAVLAHGILNAWPAAEALDTAAGFAARICAIDGAIAETDTIYAQLAQGADHGQRR